MADQPTAGVALKPLDGAFITVESVGAPETDKRSATLKITFSGEGSSERAWAARDYIDGLVKADAPAPTDAGGAVSDLLKAEHARVKATTYNPGTPAEAQKDGILRGLTKATAIAMVAEDRAALTPAPQAEGEKLPAISLDGPHKPCEHRVWLARQLLDSRLTDAEAYSTVRYSPAIKEDAQPLQQGGEVTREAVAQSVRDILYGVALNGDEPVGATADRILALFAPLAADRDKAVGLLRRASFWVPGVLAETQSTGKIGSEIRAFLSSQTEGR